MLQRGDFFFFYSLSLRSVIVSPLFCYRLPVDYHHWHSGLLWQMRQHGTKHSCKKLWIWIRVEEAIKKRRKTMK